MKESENVIMPVIPMRDMVIFPNTINPVFISRPASISALEQAMAHDRKLLFVTQMIADEENPGPEDLHSVGTVCHVLQMLRTGEGVVKVLLEGLYAATIANFMRSASVLQAVFVPRKPVWTKNRRMQALTRAILSQFEKFCELSDRIPDDLYYSISGIENPEHLTDSIANYSSIRISEKQSILEENNIERKFAVIIKCLAGEIELLEMQKKILDEVKERMGDSQKKFFLNEQLRVIEQELGIIGDDDPELEDFTKRIESMDLTEESRAKLRQEVRRLSLTPPMSPEATVSRTYIEWVLDLPWGRRTVEHIDLARAEKVLDKNHYGLVKVKERIIEYLAVHSLVKNPKGPILCLVGPPGVGKTSLARSIAHALGRKFVRVSLGGIRDEAEIRGHRSTYIGALPGKIIQGMKKAMTLNPVFLLDEVDKMTTDLHGDPAAALLEVLDPEQNSAFVDHYINLDFDLSSVMFITTANIADDIPPTLLDRMEIISMSGYTREEKMDIAMQFLVPRQVKEHGLDRRRVRFSRKSVAIIIDEYTREAGVRNLEREIACICRKIAREIVHMKASRSVAIDQELLRKYLGPTRHQSLRIHDAGEIGVATGLAWTQMGGEILPTETSIVRGKGSLILTGRLGDVMQESARAALTYIRSRCERYHLKPDFYNKVDIHVHIPEGAIPKDGPSAGVTLAASMLSALSKCPVRQDIAMTGEITLRGRVLKIGGLKEKILAAHRAHILTVILPNDNNEDLTELPSAVRNEMRFILVNNLDEAIAAAFTQSRTQ